MEEPRGEVSTDSGVASTVVLELQGSEMEGNWVPSELDVQRKDGENDFEAGGRVRAQPQMRRAVVRVESAETQDCAVGSGEGGRQQHEFGGMGVRAERGERTAMVQDGSG